MRKNGAQWHGLASIDPPAAFTEDAYVQFLLTLRAGSGTAVRYGVTAETN